jgi:hypothetical protein
MRILRTLPSLSNFDSVWSRACLHTGHLGATGRGEQGFAKQCRFRPVCNRKTRQDAHRQTGTRLPRSNRMRPERAERIWAPIESFRVRAVALSSKTTTLTATQILDPHSEFFRGTTKCKGIESCSVTTQTLPAAPCKTVWESEGDDLVFRFKRDREGIRIDGTRCLGQFRRLRLRFSLRFSSSRVATMDRKTPPGR